MDGPFVFLVTSSIIPRICGELLVQSDLGFLCRSNGFVYDSAVSQEFDLCCNSHFS